MSFDTEISFFTEFEARMVRISLRFQRSRKTNSNINDEFNNFDVYIFSFFSPVFFLVWMIFRRCARLAADFHVWNNVCGMFSDLYDLFDYVRDYSMLFTACFEDSKDFFADIHDLLNCFLRLVLVRGQDPHTPPPPAFIIRDVLDPARHSFGMFLWPGQVWPGMDRSISNCSFTIRHVFLCFCWSKI